MLIYKVSVGDIVRRREVVGQVAACLLEASTLLVLVNSMIKSRSLAVGSDLWHLSGSRQIWAANEVQQCLAWHEEPDGSLLVVRK